MMRSNYDKDFDILYVGLPDFSNAIGYDDEYNIEIMRDSDDNTVKGYIFEDFAANYSDGIYRRVSLPVKIDLDALYDQIRQC